MDNKEYIVTVDRFEGNEETKLKRIKNLSFKIIIENIIKTKWGNHCQIKIREFNFTG